jgi:hypothetical protein
VFPGIGVSFNPPVGAHLPQFRFIFYLGAGVALCGGDDTRQNIRTSEAGGSRAGILRRGVLHYGCCSGSTPAEYAGAATEYARNAEGTAASSDNAWSAECACAGQARAPATGAAPAASGYARASAEYERPRFDTGCSEYTGANRARSTSGTCNSGDECANSAYGG